MNAKNIKKGSYTKEKPINREEYDRLLDEWKFKRKVCTIGAMIPSFFIFWVPLVIWLDDGKDADMRLAFLISGGMILFFFLFTAVIGRIDRKYLSRDLRERIKVSRNVIVHSKQIIQTPYAAKPQQYTVLVMDADENIMDLNIPEKLYLNLKREDLIEIWYAKYSGFIFDYDHYRFDTED